MSRTTPASTKAQKSQCFFLLVKASPAKGRRRLQKNTDFFVLLCFPASFLTFGKVNDGPPQTDIFFGEGGPPHPAPPSFLSAPGPLRLTFFGGRGGGGVQITTLLIPCYGRVSGCHHLQTIRPTGPVRGLRSQQKQGAAQAHASRGERQIRIITARGSS